MAILRGSHDGRDDSAAFFVGPFLPDRAMDLMDEASAMIRIEIDSIQKNGCHTSLFLVPPPPVDPFERNQLAT